MFKEKAVTATSKKDDVAVNMVLAITTCKCGVQGERTFQEQELGELA